MSKQQRALRQAAESARQIEQKANCPSDKIIANYLFRRAISKLIDLKYPRPKEL